MQQPDKPGNIQYNLWVILANEMPGKGGKNPNKVQPSWEMKMKHKIAYKIVNSRDWFSRGTSGDQDDIKIGGKRAERPGKIGGRTTMATAFS
jgi:hypothetical protein